MSGNAVRPCKQEVKVNFGQVETAAVQRWRLEGREDISKRCWCLCSDEDKSWKQLCRNSDPVGNDELLFKIIGEVASVSLMD